eukprot:1182115-Prorocentrum_minimum.AAC.2
MLPAADWSVAGIYPGVALSLSSYPVELEDPSSDPSAPSPLAVPSAPAASSALPPPAGEGVEPEEGAGRWLQSHHGGERGALGEGRAAAEELRRRAVLLLEQARGAFGLRHNSPLGVRSASFRRGNSRGIRQRERGRHS